MADILFPPLLCPAAITWTLERSIGVFESPLSFATQRVVRSGARWRATVQMPPMDAESAALLTAWLDQISRAENCGLVPVAQNRDAGTEAATFVSAQAPFTAANVVNDWNGSRGFAAGLLIPPYYQSGDLVLYSGNTTENRTAPAFSATAGLPYAAVLDVPLQPAPPTWRVTGASGSPVHFTSVGVQGRSIGTWNAVTAQNVVDLFIGNGSTPFTQSRYTSITLNRILITEQTASAGATRVTLMGGNSAAPALAMRRGQYFEIRTSAGWELKRLTTDVDLIAAVTFNGNSVNHFGNAVFEPALRGSVAANAAILTHKPVCRMRLAEPNSSSTADGPLFTGATFDLVEWFGA